MESSRLPVARCAGLLPLLSVARVVSTLQPQAATLNVTDYGVTPNDRTGDDMTIQRVVAAAGPMLDLSGLTAVEVSSLTLDGNTNQNADGIYSQLGGQLNLHHLTIRDQSGANGSLEIHFNGNSSP